jgi:membrane-bound lytic murein transglycosylase F
MASSRWPMRFLAALTAQLAFALALLAAAPCSAADEDLAAIRLRGTLRVLVLAESTAELPRNAPGFSSAELVQEFAARQGLKVQEIPCGRSDLLLPALLEGKGDVVAVGLTATLANASKVAFTQPLWVVDEVLVGMRGAPGLPVRPSELSGRKVSAVAGSAAEESLQALKASSVPGLIIDALSPTSDAEQMLYEVSRGERALAVATSTELERLETYNPGLQHLFTVAERRPVSWAVRPSAQALRAALDGFLLEKGLVAHATRRFTTDLDGLVTHGELRVITRNNGVSYFLERGQPRGFDYELAAMLAKQLKLRLQMVVPPAHDQMVPWLLEGRGDVIAASYTVTADRARMVDFSRPYLQVQEMVVQRKGEAPLRSLSELKGRRITVRLGSSYAETLARLQPQVGFTIVPAPEDVETEDLIDAVASGAADLTIADSHILQEELTWRTNVVGALALEPGSKKDLAFAVRVGNPKLLAAVNDFVKRSARGLDFNLAYRRTFEVPPAPSVQDGGVKGGVSSFDAIFQKFAPRYGFDWRLTAAQAYQESRFDPKARSREGAVGLLQILPRTAQSLGFSRLTDPEECTHAGIAYLAELMGQLEPDLALQQRVRFALAAYNVGIGHLTDARRLASEQGLDKNRWFGNVEKAMLELQKPAHYRRARYGYARGSEPVKYVSEIQTRYEQYLTLVP